MSKEKFNKLIKLASQPDVKESDKLKSDDDYNEKQTRSRKTEDTSKKQRGKFR